MKLKDLWNRISNLGVTDDLTEYERRRVILLNQSMASVCLLPIIYSISFFSPANPLSSVAVCSSEIIIFSTWIANYHKKYALGRWIGLVGYIMYINLLIVLHGKEVGGNLTYVVLGMYGLAYFPKKFDRIIIFSLILISLAATEYYVYNYESIYALEVTYVISLSALLGNFLALAILMVFLDYDQKKYLFDTEALLEELRSKNKELEHKNKKIAIQNDRLTSLNGELRDFAYATSHHFKTPLRSIHSFMGLLEKQLDAETLKKVEDYLRFAKESSIHLYELTQNLLAFSKLSVSETEKTYIDLNEVVGWVQKNLNDKIEKKNVQFDLTSLPVVFGHQFHFELLFQNIIDNGIKYNDVQNPLIKIEFEEDLMDFRIKISDNGIGISEKFQEKIFDMFSRLHTPDQYEGTGLGLSICRKIVVQYEGNISLRSAEGKGSTFILEFPTVMINKAKGNHLPNRRERVDKQ